VSIPAAGNYVIFSKLPLDDAIALRPFGHDRRRQRGAGR
jgi:hypothetical protein